MPLDSEGQLYMNSIYKRETLKKLSVFTVIPEGAISSHGISNPVNRKAKVEHALARALEIRKNVEELSQIKEEAVLMSLGI